MSTEKVSVILGPGISLSNWIAGIQAALVRRRCLGHVFHTIPGIKSGHCPEKPEKKTITDVEYKVVSEKYDDELAKWTEGEIEARNILVNRITKDICPQNFLNMTAKQLFNHVANVRDEGATTPWEIAVRRLLRNTYTTSADQYCNEFLQNYLDVNSAAESVGSGSLQGSEDPKNSFTVSPGLAAFMFILGTEEISWLDTWRQTKVYDGNNKYISLDIMISTLRQVASTREGMSGHGQYARGQKNLSDELKGRSLALDPEEYCTRCKHKHKNKYCFKQHPELKKKRRKGRNAKTVGHQIPQA